jgi:recombination associated protein RdgC
MFFKSFSTFHLVNYTHDLAALEESMRTRLFQECRPDQAFSAGWVPAFGEDTKMMTRNASGATLFAIKIEERKVKASALKVEVETACAEAIARQIKAGVENPTLAKYEKQEIKEHVHARMLKDLPKSMSNYTIQYAYMDPKAELLIMNGTSTTKMDIVSYMLRDAVPFCSMIRAQTTLDMAEEMSAWLKGDMVVNEKEELTVGMSCSLRSELEKTSTIKYKKQELNDDNLRNYLKSKHVVSDVELCWENNMNLTLTEEFCVKGIRLQSVLKGEINAQIEGYQGKDVEIALFDAEFSIMVDTFNKIVPVLAQAFNGFAPIDAQLSQAPEPLEG